MDGDMDETVVEMADETPDGDLGERVDEVVYRYAASAKGSDDDAKDASDSGRKLANRAVGDEEDTVDVACVPADIGLSCRKRECASIDSSPDEKANEPRGSAESESRSRKWFAEGKAATDGAGAGPPASASASCRAAANRALAARRRSSRPETSSSRDSSVSTLPGSPFIANHCPSFL